MEKRVLETGGPVVDERQREIRFEATWGRVERLTLPDPTSTQYEHRSSSSILSTSSQNLTTSCCFFGDCPALSAFRWCAFAFPLRPSRAGVFETSV